MAVYGVVALVLVALAYFFVTAGSALWPGGPRLQPEAARNLSISLILVEVLLCCVLFGSLGSLFPTAALPPETGGGAGPEDDGGTAIAGVTLTAQAALDATATRVAGEAPPTEEPTLAPVSDAPTLTASPTSGPPPAQPSATPTATANPTPTPFPTALPVDPNVLIETVLRTVIERANDAEVDALLSGDEGQVDPWWSGQARDRVLVNVRNVRSRFVQVTEVTWTPVGEGIRLLSNTPITATYTTSERWTFVGDTGQLCPDGSPRLRRSVETYPSEQYTLELREGFYTVTEWQLGEAVVNEDRLLPCP